MNARSLTLLLACSTLVGALVYWLQPQSEVQPATGADPRPRTETHEPLASEQPTSASVLTARAPASEPTASTPTTATPPPRYRLVDDQTGEPTPHFEVLLEPGSVAASSDAEGVLVFSTAPEVGAEIVLADNERSMLARIATRSTLAEQFAARVKLPTRAAGDEVVDVPIPVGPTYRLALALAPAIALSELSFELVCADPSQRFDLAPAALRDPAQPWLRFHPTARLMRGGPPWRVQARSTDGLWFASALVSSNVGIQHDVVALVFEPRARLVGAVRDDKGAALDDGYVRIDRDGASPSDESNHAWLGRVGTSGEYEIGCAPPGEYSVRLDRDGYLPFKASVTLPVGQTTRFDLALAKPAATESGRVLVRIESSTGAFDRTVYPFLRPAGQKTGARRGKVTWSDEGGRRVGAIVYDDVPFGDYDAGLQAPGFVMLEQRELRVRPGDPEIVFRIRDDVWPLAPLEIHAADESGAALTGFLAALTVKASWGEATDRAKGERGRARFEAAPIGVRAQLKVTMPDWQPLWSEIDLDASTRELRVTLKPGWGIEVTVRGADGAALEGARVYFDDEIAGETNANGELFVARSATPQRARVEYRDWKPTANSRLDAEGNFRNFEPWLTVELAPAR